MKKVLIADDEFLVRLGLKTTINWEENGFIIVGEAKNGKEALELFEKHEPDILLTDIRMPVMSGLELIQEIKKRKKGLKAAILSHYDDFSYAREAIKLGASEYILKSDLSSENLLETLKKLSDEINSENAILDKNLNPASYNNDFDCLQFMEQLIMSNFKLEQDIPDLINRFKYNSFILVSGHIEDIIKTGSGEDQEQFSKAFKNVSQQVFADENLVHVLNFKQEGFVFLINIDVNGKTDEAQDKLLEILSSFKKQIKQFLGVEIALGLSEPDNISNDLRNLLQQSKTALQNCFFDDTGIHSFNESMLIKRECNIQVSIELLKNFVKSNDTKNLNEFIESTFTDLQELRVLDYVRDVFTDFLSYARILKTEMNLKNGYALSETKFSYSNFNKLYNISAVQKYVIDIFDSLVYCNSSSKADSYSFIISKSIKFIKTNYQSNITLSDVADHVEISSSYLSLLFKQETGINFSNYLINYRIEMSKKLLTESNMKIYEIAEKVGFENPYYFSKVFKEITGLTCKEYKKNYFLKENIN